MERGREEGVIMRGSDKESDEDMRKGREKEEIKRVIKT